MDIATLNDSPRNKRGAGQVSHLLLTQGQFGSRHLSVTWVECQPNSQQAMHTHSAQEQVYVIMSGRGQMLVGDEECEVGAGALVFVPPATPHAIRNTGAELLVYVSATAPPFKAAVKDGTWEIPGTRV